MRDLYRRMSRNRRALKLDRCAIDHPELASVWFEQGRYGQVALLATYLEKRIDQGTLRPIANVELAARMVLETIALSEGDNTPTRFRDPVYRLPKLEAVLTHHGLAVAPASSSAAESGVTSVTALRSEDRSS